MVDRSVSQWKEDQKKLDEEAEAQDTKLMTDDEMDWLLEALQREMFIGDERIEDGAKAFVQQLRKDMQKAKESKQHWHNRDIKRFGKSDRTLTSKWRITAMGI